MKLLHHLTMALFAALALVSTRIHAQDAFDTWTSYETSQGALALSPYDLEAADLDGDGDLDLAVSNYWSVPKLCVMLNQGGGVYANPTYYAGQSSLCLESADLDGDGDLDLVASNYGTIGQGTTVSVYRNAGDGTFAPQQLYAAGKAPIGLALADFDGDADVDIAVANNYFGAGNKVCLLWNDGTGGFSAPALFDAGADTWGTQLDPYALQAGDLDGDGLLDLVVGNDDQYVSVLRNTGGAFAAPVSQSTGMGPSAGAYPSLAVEDVDQDGDLDVVYSNTLTYVFVSAPYWQDAGAAAVFRNDGTGTLGAPEGYALHFAHVGFSGFQLADVTGDGWVDAVGAWQADGGWGVAPGDGAGGFVMATEYTSGADPMAVEVHDVDADGDLDVLTVSRESLEVGVHLNPGDGDFAAPPVAKAGTFSNHSMDAADVDADGDLDVAICRGSLLGGGGVTVLLNQGGTLVAQPEYPASQEARNVRLRELNGDGFPDLVWADDTDDPPYNFKTRMNLGDGTFGPEANWYANTCGTWDLDAWDLDGDGDLDVVLCELLACFGGISPEKVYISLNHGDGTFAPAYQIKSPGGFSVDAGDMDLDGNLDLVVGSASAINLMRGNGDGTFQPPLQIDTFYVTDQVAVADFNNDGNPDVAYQCTDMPSTLYVNGMSILLGNGDLTFQPSTFYEGCYSVVTELETGDLEGDGDVDVFMSNYFSSTVSVFVNQGDGTFADEQRYGTAGGLTDLRFEDFTGDGVGDLAVLIPMIGHSYGNGAGVEVIPGIPACPGEFASYGRGLAGTGGKVPLLTGDGCPVLGESIALRVSNGLTSAPALFLVGSAPVSLPLLGGTLLSAADLIAPVIQLDPAGAAVIPTTIPDNPSLVGVSFFTQALVADAGAAQGVSFTAGLEMRIE